jgi:hypothetical protein
MTSIQRTALIIPALLLALAVPDHAWSSGYWQIQGNNATVVFGPNGSGAREWVSQGTNIQVIEASARHAVITKSGNVGGGFNTMTFRAEWTPPVQVLPGEVVGVSVTSSVGNVNYGRPEWPMAFETAECQWQGVGEPVMVLPGEDIPAKASGAARTKTNTSVMAKAPAPGTKGGEAKLICGLNLVYGWPLLATTPYVWVEGAAPAVTASTLAPTPTPAPAPGDASIGGNWTVDFNGYTGTMDLTPSGGGWRGRFNIGGGWEEMTNLRISGTSVTFDRVNGSQHYEGQLGPGGMSGIFNQGGSGQYRWSARRLAAPGGPPAPGAAAGPLPTGAGTAARVLFFNGNDGSVSNGGKSPAVSFGAPVTVGYVMTYHWNGGRGAGGGGTIALLHESGTMYGPWPVNVVNNVYWEVRPNAQLPAGRYQVIDSDPATWAQNGGSQGFGHVRIRGY